MFQLKLENNWQILLKTPAWAGVWIFIIISGFFSGKRFLYTDITWAGVLEFYKDKFCKVLLPTWVFIFIAYVLCHPLESVTWQTKLRFVFCFFYGPGAAKGIGASWYVFTLMWLYVITPAICKFINWTNRHFGKSPWILVLMLFMFGLTYRVIGRILGLQWYRDIYASPIGNLDLYIIGILANYLIAVKFDKRFWRISSIAGIVVLNVFCSVCYYYGEETIPLMLSIYRYLCPTAYAAITGLFLVSWQNFKVENENAPSRFIRFLSDISFQFYLWHTTILYGIANRFVGDRAFTSHVLLMSIGCLLTIVMAYLMTVMSEGLSLRVKTLTNKILKTNYSKE